MLLGRLARSVAVRETLAVAPTPPERRGLWAVVVVGVPVRFPRSGPEMATASRVASVACQVLNPAREAAVVPGRCEGSVGSFAAVRMVMVAGVMALTAGCASSATDASRQAAAPSVVAAPLEASLGAMTFPVHVSVQNQLPVPVQLSAFTPPYDVEELSTRQWNDRTGSPALPAPAGFAGDQLQPTETAAPTFMLPTSPGGTYPFTLLVKDVRGGVMASVPLQARWSYGDFVGWGVVRDGGRLDCDAAVPLTYRDQDRVLRNGSFALRCGMANTPITLRPAP